MPKDPHGLDAIDRKLLGLLSQGAEQTYAEIGKQVGLSAPAVHERVKRYKATGRIKSVSAQLDPAMTGKSLLAFVHVDSTGWGKSQAMLDLCNFPEVEEMHTVAGDACMVLKVRTENTQALEALLARIYDMPEVQTTKSYVALSTVLERPVQAGITEELREKTFQPRD
ncbi:Leucine-responsive regulatory protein [Roseovarius albus]|uniref:Leucine-responsive regulatory protein n=1 Tax=Roseovarius albus TaxID=1247867 RepID=A0A1X6YNL9_9RHOB|nr:Lrp/AsnC family transcriptional regulator [Roseovarius albus]SLN25922.1 Leucine-responsive regulatory protein [Roseovarius albus]